MNVEAVKGDNWNDFFVDFDKKADRIPIVSTVTNVVDLVLKGALSLMDQKRLETVLESRFFRHIHDKSYYRCVTLLVPFLGNYIIYVYDTKNGQLQESGVLNKDGTPVSKEEESCILEQFASDDRSEVSANAYVLPTREQPASAALPEPEVPAEEELPNQAPHSSETPPDEAPADPTKVPKPRLIQARLRIN